MTNENNKLCLLLHLFDTQGINRWLLFASFCQPRCQIFPKTGAVWHVFVLVCHLAFGTCFGTIRLKVWGPCTPEHNFQKGKTAMSVVFQLCEWHVQESNSIRKNIKSKPNWLINRGLEFIIWKNLLCRNSVQKPTSLNKRVGLLSRPYCTCFKFDALLNLHVGLFNEWNSKLSMTVFLILNLEKPSLPQVMKTKIFL